MKKVFLTATAVAALVVGGHLASAQTGHRGAGGMAQSPAAGDAAAEERGAVKGEHRGTQPAGTNAETEEGAGHGAGATRRERTGETREPAGDSREQHSTKASHQRRDENDRAGERSERRGPSATGPESRERMGQERDRNERASERREPNERTGEGREQNERMGEGRGQNDRTPTGEGREPHAVQLSSEQRTRIRDTIVHDHEHRVEHVDFPITVGTRIPRTEHVYQLPTDLVSIVPEYRGFKYILVRDELVILDPVTLEIVAVILV